MVDGDAETPPRAYGHDTAGLRNVEAEEKEKKEEEEEEEEKERGRKEVSRGG
jgi:ribosomal protein L12E/L44/L45/RPP1/RPP2